MKRRRSSPTGCCRRIGPDLGARGPGERCSHVREEDGPQEDGSGLRICSCGATVRPPRHRCASAAGLSGRGLEHVLGQLVMLDPGVGVDLTRREPPAAGEDEGLTAAHRVEEDPDDHSCGLSRR